MLCWVHGSLYNNPRSAIAGQRIQPPSLADIPQQTGCRSWWLSSQATFRALSGLGLATAAVGVCKAGKRSLGLNKKQATRRLSSPPFQAESKP